MEFIPKVVGRGISDLERSLLSLPCRLGGMGIQIPTETAAQAYNDSIYITEPLVKKIKENDPYLDHKSLSEIEKRKRQRMKINDDSSLRKQEEILRQLPDHLKRLTNLNSEKGSSIWLTTLPLIQCGFHLNKRTFIDALCMRYDWPVKDMPRSCACGQQNSLEHALSCKMGGYVIKRHNEIRDLEAELLSEVCVDVKRKPQLIPLTGEPIRGNQASEARLDVSAVGLWAPNERSFMDVRIFSPMCKSYLGREPEEVYRSHENQKKRDYNDRVINVERATFSPLIISTTGGWGKEAHAFHRRLALLIAEKRKDDFANVMSFIRKRIRFNLLRTTLLTLRGNRQTRQKKHEQNLNYRILDIYFNLVDISTQN